VLVFYGTTNRYTDNS